MSNPTPRPPDRRASDASPSLLDRVRDRVAIAETRLAAAPMGAEPQATRALWLVFRDFGNTRRRYRRATGEPPLPALREAATAFRKMPSMTTLVAVAAILDQQGLLPPSK